MPMPFHHAAFLPSVFCQAGDAYCRFLEFFLPASHACLLPFITGEGDGLPGLFAYSPVQGWRFCSSSGITPALLLLSTAGCRFIFHCLPGLPLISLLRHTPHFLFRQAFLPPMATLRLACFACRQCLSHVHAKSCPPPFSATTFRHKHVWLFKTRHIGFPDIVHWPESSKWLFCRLLHAFHQNCSSFLFIMFSSARFFMLLRHAYCHYYLGLVIIKNRCRRR